MEFTVVNTERLFRVTWICVIMWTLLLTNPCGGDGPCTGISCLIGCSTPPSIFRDKHLTTNENRARYGIGSLVMYHCQENYTTQGGSPYSRCNNQQTWTFPTLKCKEMIRSPLNWTLEISHILDEDNQTVGAKHEWGYPIGPGLNNKGLCGNPPSPPAHSIIKHIDKLITSGSKAHYICESGYKYVSGTTLSWCRRHGEWYPIEITINCTEKVCVLPTLPINGQPSQTAIHPVGTNISFSCQVGYNLIGQRQQVCQEDETWSGQHPSCEPSRCQTPRSQPDNGHIKPHQHLYSYGTTVEYVCNHGYRVVGDAFRSCQGNGQWSGESPTCQAVDCGFPKVSNAEVNLSQNTTSYLSTAYIKCRTGALYGILVYCNSHGKWRPHLECNGSQPTSVPTSTVPTRPVANADPQDRRGLSTKSVTNEPGVYQERMSSGSTLHNTCPFILLSLLLYLITDVI